ncbi:MAG: tape measure protein [Desulfurivibrionaceae bacterium]
MSSQDAAINIAIRMTDQITAPYAKAMAMVERSTGAAEKRMQALGMAAKVLSTAFVGVMAIMGGVDIIKTADTWNNLHGRLKLVTESTAQLADVEQRLFGIAQNSRVGYEETATLYARIARSTQEMNLGQEQTLTITDTINKSLIVSGSSAQAADAALIQLGQGFASGALRGQELNSVLEQAPRLAEAIADGMGVSVGQLRKLGEEGKLTAEAVAQALVSQSAAVTAEFEKMPKTVGQAMTVINNKIGQMISGQDQATSFTAKLADGIIYLANNLGELSLIIAPLPAMVMDLANNFGSLTHALEPIGMFLAVGGTLYAGLVGLPMVLGEVETGIGLVASAIAGATLGTGTLTAAVAANPILAGIIVATGVIAYLWQYVDAADAATDKTEDWNKQVEEIGRTSENITEFQGKLATLQEEANKKLREDSWLYQLQKWTGGIWLDEKWTAMMKRGQELGLTDSATGRAAMKSAHRDDPFPGKTFDMAYADQGNAALNYDAGLGFIKDKVRSQAPRPLSKEAEDAAKKAQKEAERLSEQWTSTRRDLEQEINLSGLDGLEKKLQEITYKAEEYHLQFDKAGGKAAIDDWEEATKAVTRQADEIEKVTKAIEYKAQANEDLLSLEKELELAVMSKDQREIQGIKESYDLLRNKSHLLTLMEKQTEEEEARDSAVLEVRMQEDLASIKNKTNDLTEFQKQAYQNMQDAGANFFESLRTGSDNWLDNFTDMTLKMVDQWAAAQAMMGLFGEDYGKGGELGGLLGTAVTAIGGMFGSSGGITASAAPGISYAGSYDSMVGSSAPFDFAFADGGWIHEPVVGRGLRSGARYSFAENESELILNQKQVRAASSSPSAPSPASSGNGTINVTIIAADAQSFTDMVRRNPEAVMGPFREALKKGDRGLRSDLQRVIS